MISQPKIYVVEDDTSIRFGLTEIFRGEGFEVACCDTGDAAVEGITQFKPDLVILDVMLPGKNGYEICKQLRADGFCNPILMLTAKGQEIDKVVGLDTGADDYVTKPFGVQELKARVNALLRRSNDYQVEPPSLPNIKQAAPLLAPPNTKPILMTRCFG